MPSDRQIKAQLRQVEQMQRESHDDPRTDAELYGIAQTLAWVLEMDVMAPALCAASGWPIGPPGTEDAK